MSLAYLFHSPSGDLKQLILQLIGKVVDTTIARNTNISMTLSCERPGAQTYELYFGDGEVFKYCGMFNSFWYRQKRYFTKEEIEKFGNSMLIRHKGADGKYSEINTVVVTPLMSFQLPENNEYSGKTIIHYDFYIKLQPEFAKTICYVNFFGDPKSYQFKNEKRAVWWSFSKFRNKHQLIKKIEPQTKG